MSDFNWENLQQWGRVFQDYEAELSKLQDMLKDYYHYNDVYSRMPVQKYDEYEHFELIRSSQTMTDQDKKTLAEFGAYAKPKLSEIIGVKNVPMSPCERYTNGITVNILFKVKFIKCT